MADDEIKEGDEVAWNWGGGAPGGTATKVKESAVTMETKSGNTVKRKGEPGNPAVYIERSGHDVVKKASELKVKSKASSRGKSGGGSSNGGKTQDAKAQKSSKAGANNKQAGKQAKRSEQYGIAKKSSAPRRSSRLAASK